jgi:ATP/maltotriose-dependent transcriptional regulator MalT/DNA-binding SARP family transcriptional activator
VTVTLHVPRRRITPPTLPVNHVERPNLVAKLAEAAQQRVAYVLAGPGYGKTTLLAAFARDTSCAWYSLEREDAELAAFVPGLLAAVRQQLPGAAADPMAGLGPQASATTLADGVATLVAEAVEGTGAEFVLVLDDLHELPAGGASARLVEALCRLAPPNLHLVLASRQEPPFPVARLRGRGQLRQLDSAQLSFAPIETRRLVTSLMGRQPTPDQLVRELHELTGGWPAALCLAIDVVRQGVDPAGRLRSASHSSGALAAYLAEEVLDNAEPGLRDLLLAVAPFRRFTSGLCAAIGVDITDSQLHGLAQRGLLLGPSEDAEPIYRLPQALATATDGRVGVPRRNQLLAAIQWMSEHGWLVEGLAAVTALGDLGELAGYLDRYGSRLLAAGQIRAVVTAAERIPAARRSEQIQLMCGQAHQILGEWEEALDCFRSVAGGDGPLPAAIAWRMGLIHYFRGELATTLEVLQRADLTTAGDADQALVLSWTSSVHWLRREQAPARTTAAAALAAALRSGQYSALATAHTARAMVAAMDGDRAVSASHYRHARTAAERGDDLLALIRVCNNQGSRRLEEGRYDVALEEFSRTIDLAEMTGYASLLALGLHNRGEVRRGLGQLSEAAADFAKSLEVYRKMDSHWAAYPLMRLSHLDRERGDLIQARLRSEEALAEAELAEDAQVIVPALAGLARIIVDDDPDRAQNLAAHAIGYGAGTNLTEAVLAAGWVALARGEPETAAQWATRAIDLARARGHRAGTAEALELSALATEQPALLAEAGELWEALGDRLGQAVNLLVTARLTGLPSAPAERRLHELGVRIAGCRSAGALRCVVPVNARPEVEVRTLGGFQVLRAGRALGPDDWRSKKARELLKVLIARHGRGTPRDILAETLWPDDESDAVANRLAVALSTLRTVLDPERTHPVDYYVQTDKGTVSLSGLRADVEDFLAHTQEGLALRTAGNTDQARVLLETAEAEYAGDFLEDDPYADWAVALREEARAAYFSSARALIEMAIGDGEVDLAMRYMLRLLERDPYDEDMHLRLVSLLAQSGRYGEARRRYRIYLTQMAALGIEPAPLPHPSPHPLTQRVRPHRR